MLIYRGTPVAQWLRYCATNRKAAGSIPASVSGFFIDISTVVLQIGRSLVRSQLVSVDFLLT